MNLFSNLEHYSAGRLKSIDFLRGVAATSVVLYHSSLFGNYQSVQSTWFRWLEAVLHQGYLGVPLFFVISGFCIHAKAAKQLGRGEEVRVDFVGFWKRRIFRLYPTYFVVLTLSMLLVLLAYMLGQSAALVEIYPDPKPLWMLYDYVAHLTMLHGFHPIFDQAGGNPPLWTLAREEYLYLMYFPLLFLRQSLGLLRTVIAVASAGVLAYWLGYATLTPESEFWKVFASSALVLWIQWVAGAAAAEIYFGSTPNMRLRWGHCFLAFPVAFALGKYSEITAPSLAPLLWAITFGALVMGCTKLEKIGGWPKNRFLNAFSRIGIFSYSLYLIHNPVVGVTKRLIGPLASTLNPVAYVLTTLLIAVVCFAVAFLLFQTVERHFLRLPQIGSGKDVLRRMPASR